MITLEPFLRAVRKLNCTDLGCGLYAFKLNPATPEESLMHIAFSEGCVYIREVWTGGLVRVTAEAHLEALATRYSLQLGIPTKVLLTQPQ